jgi:hypothetical protein
VRARCRSRFRTRTSRTRDAKPSGLRRGRLAGEQSDGKAELAHAIDHRGGPDSLVAFVEDVRAGGVMAGVNWGLSGAGCEGHGFGPTELRFCSEERSDVAIPLIEGIWRWILASLRSSQLSV